MRSQCQLLKINVEHGRWSHVISNRIEILGLQKVVALATIAKMLHYCLTFQHAHARLAELKTEPILFEVFTVREKTLLVSLI